MKRHSQAGVSLIEVMVAVGIIGILATGIASISNYGFQSLRGVRIGNDLQAVNRLVALNLSRPATAQDLALGQSVCKRSLPALSIYQGNRIQNIDVRDAAGKSLLVSLKDQLNPNKADQAKDYVVTAEVDEKISGPYPVKYPDELNNGALTDFQFYITQLIIKGTKTNEDKSPGGSVTRARVALGVITRTTSLTSPMNNQTYPANSVYDCLANPIDYKHVCMMLGGTYTENPNWVPRCLLMRLPIAWDWTRIPNDTAFQTGDLFVQEVMGIGDKTQVKNTRLLRTRNLARGVAIGGTGGFGLAMGQAIDLFQWPEMSSQMYLGADLNGQEFFSLSAITNPSFWGAEPYFPNGYAKLQTTGNRPWLFDNVNNGPGKMGMILSGTRKFFYTEGGAVASRMEDAGGFLTGAITFGFFRENNGFASYYRDGRSIILGMTPDFASGAIFVNNAPGPSGHRAFAGIYHAANYSEPGSNNAAVVLKAYNSNDLIFQIRQEPLPCTGCTPMVISGKTGDVAIGMDIAVPNARVQVRAATASGDGLRVDGPTRLTRATTINGNVVISGNLLISNGNLICQGTIYAESDENLKTRVAPISNALDKILQLNGVSYRWKKAPAKSPRTIGVIAQDVETVFPELIRTNGDGLKSVQYANLVAPMIEAIRERQTQIKKLRKDRDQLKESLDRIVERLCDKKPQPSLCLRYGTGRE